MFRLLLLLCLIIFLARAFWQLVDGVVEGATGRSPRGAKRNRGIAMARDPVCGTFVVPDRAVPMTVAGEQLYFCSTACRDRFRDQRRATGAVRGKSA
jgi:YHS domain-containing protein